MSANKSLPATRRGTKDDVRRFAQTRPARTAHDVGNARSDPPEPAPTPVGRPSASARPLPSEFESRPHGTDRDPDDDGESHRPSAERARGLPVLRLPDPEFEPRIHVEHAPPSDPERAEAARRNNEIPLSMGPATLVPGSGPVVGVGLGQGPREPRLYPPEEPEPPAREADPSQPAAPWLKADPDELAEDPHDTMQAREQADSPERGADSPGTQQDQ